LLLLASSQLREAEGEGEGLLLSGENSSANEERSSPPGRGDGTLVDGEFGNSIRKGEAGDGAEPPRGVVMFGIPALLGDALDFDINDEAASATPSLVCSRFA